VLLFFFKYYYPNAFKNLKQLKRIVSRKLRHHRTKTSKPEKRVRLDAKKEEQVGSCSGMHAKKQRTGLATSKVIVQPITPAGSKRTPPSVIDKTPSNGKAVLGKHGNQQQRIVSSASSSKVRQATPLRASVNGKSSTLKAPVLAKTTTMYKVSTPVTQVAKPTANNNKVSSAGSRKPYQAVNTKAMAVSNTPVSKPLKLLSAPRIDLSFLDEKPTVPSRPTAKTAQSKAAMRQLEQEEAKYDNEEEIVMSKASKQPARVHQIEDDEPLEQLDEGLAEEDYQYKFVLWNT